MNEQLELFDPVTLLSEEAVENAVIDAAFCHVENQSVLRQLLAGKSWSEAFGAGGSSLPVNWFGDSKGIVLWNEPRKLIKPARIIARAKLYKPVNHFLTSQPNEYEQAN